MEKKLYQDFISNLITLDVDQYNKLNKELKNLRFIQSVKVKNSLDIGDKVMVIGGKKLNNETGVIKKINRTRAIVNIDGDKREWNIPFTMLTKI